MRSFPTPSRFGSRRQRGAIGLFVALTLLLMVLFTALAVDTGRLAMQQRELQKIADLAALDASQALCSQDDAAVAAQTSAVRNGYTGNLITEGGVRLGSADADGEGIRRFAETAEDVATAVQVTARHTVPASLVAGGLWGGTVPLTAIAVAKGGEESIAGISAGSFLARVNTSTSGLNTLLSGLLGTNVSLGLADYQGLAAADLRLLDLIEARDGIGTVDELLELRLGMADWLRLMATALTTRGNTAVAATLNNLALGIVSGLQLTLGDLLKVTTEAPETAANAAVNALDLLVLGSEVAKGSAAVDLSTGVTIPNVTDIGLKLWLIQPPQIAIGPAGQDDTGHWKTEARTAQARVGVTLQLLPGTLGIPLVATIRLVDLSLAVDVAPTSAWLEALSCPSPANPNGLATVGSQTGVATLAIGALDGNGNVTGPANVATVRALVGLVTATIGVSASTTITGGAHSTEFGGPFPETRTVGTPLDEALGNALNSLADHLTFVVTVGSLPLGATLSSVVALITPVLRPIILALGTVLTPLLQALGVNLGGADLGVFGVLFTSDTGRPALAI